MCSLFGYKCLSPSKCPWIFFWLVGVGGDNGLVSLLWLGNTCHSKYHMMMEKEQKTSICSATGSWCSSETWPAGPGSSSPSGPWYKLDYYSLTLDSSKVGGHFPELKASVEKLGGSWELPPSIWLHELFQNRYPYIISGTNWSSIILSKRLE